MASNDNQLRENQALLQRVKERSHPQKDNGKSQAQPPKPRGKSSGWSEGQPHTRRIRYPTVKKNTTKSKNKLPKSA